MSNVCDRNEEPGVSIEIFHVSDSRHSISLFWPLVQPKPIPNYF